MTGRPNACPYWSASSSTPSVAGPVNSYTAPRWSSGAASIAVTTSATSLEATGDVRPLPNGSASWPDARIAGAASAVKSGLSSKTVGRTCTAGTPDQSMTRSASQCRRCCLDSAVLVAVICETVICDMLTSASKVPSSLAATHTTVVACR